MKARVGISRCLIGDAVRYDGTDKRADDLLREWDAVVEWVAVCPEVEIGMGTPREPIHIVGPRRLVGVTSGRDWTEPMQSWARTRVSELRALSLSGYVFKARSPSCGIGPAPGLFAEALMRALPELPVADEDELSTPDARDVFLQRVLAYRGS